MKSVDFSKELAGLDGKELFKEKDTPLKLSDLAITALLSGDDKDAAKKMEAWLLAKRISKGGPVDLKAEEVVLLKRKAGEHLTVQACGLLCDEIE